MRISRLGAAAVVTLLTAACGDSTGPSFATTADAAELSTLADQGEGFAASTMVSPLTTGEPLVLLYGHGTPAAAHAMAMRYLQAAMRRAAGERSGPSGAAPMAFRSLSPGSHCVPKITGIGPDSLPIDRDKDGVPDDWKIDYGTACVDQDSTGTHRTTYQGSVEFKDTGIGIKSALAIVQGFRATEVGNVDWGTLVNWADGTEMVAFTAAKATDEVHLVAGQIIPGSDHYFAEDFTSTYVADEGKSFALGEPTPTGMYDLRGEFRFVQNSLDPAYGELPPNFLVTLSTPTPLHVTFGCDGWVDTGVLRGVLTGQPLVGFQVTYPGCGQDYQKEIFGATP